MSASTKIIHFPGATGQRRQAKYKIVASPFGIPGVVLDTKIVFIEDENDPAKFDPSWESVLSQDTGSERIPNYLVNKVLLQELSNCRLDFIKVFFVTEPNESAHRAVHRWDFTVDMDNPIADDPSSFSIRLYSSWWDKFKSMFGFPGAKFVTRWLTENPCAGVYSVHIEIDKPMVTEDERLEILQAIGMASRTI